MLKKTHRIPVGRANIACCPWQSVNIQAVESLEECHSTCFKDLSMGCKVARKFNNFSSTFVSHINSSAVGLVAVSLGLQHSFFFASAQFCFLLLPFTCVGP